MRIMEVPAKEPQRTRVVPRRGAGVRRKYGTPAGQAKRAQEASMEARLASAGPRGGAYDPDIAAFNELVEDAEGGYTALDFAKQVYGFPGKVYDDVDQTLRSLIGLPETLATHTPLDVAEAAVPEMIEQYSDPVRYANEHPGLFMMDLAGVLGAPAALSRASRAGGLLDDAAMAGRLGADAIVNPSPTMLDPAFPQAIGAFGRRLETGEMPSALSYERQMAKTASSPSLGHAQFHNPAEAGAVLMKKAGPNDVYSQGAQEIASAEVARLAGSRPRFPGVQEHPSVPYGGGPGQHGALIEHVEEIPGEGILGPKSIKDIFAKSRKPSDMSFDEQRALVFQDLRDIGLFDASTGNPDRWFGQNTGAFGGRPLAYDQGLALGRSDRLMTRKQGDLFAPSEVWKAQGKRGLGELTPDEIEFLELLESIYQNPTPTLMRTAGPDALLKAIERTQRMMSDKNLYTHPGSINAGGYGEMKIRGGEFPDAAAAEASRLVRDIQDAAAEQGSAPGLGVVPNPSSFLPSVHGGNTGRIVRDMNEAMAAEGVTPGQHMRSDPGMDPFEDSRGDMDLGFIDMGPPPPSVSQFATPSKAPGIPTAQEWQGRAIEGLDKVLDVGERKLMRDVVNGFPHTQQGHLDAINFLRNVWGKRVKGQPFPKRPVGTGTSTLNKRMGVLEVERNVHRKLVRAGVAPDRAREIVDAMNTKELQDWDLGNPTAALGQQQHLPPPPPPINPGAVGIPGMRVIKFLRDEKGLGLREAFNEFQKMSPQEVTQFLRLRGVVPNS